MRNIFGVIDNQGGSFKQYFLENNMPVKIDNLKLGLDKKSCGIVDKCLYRMSHLPDLSKSSLFFVEHERYIKEFETQEERFFRELYESESKKYGEEFDLGGDCYNVDTFLFHHGLYFQNTEVKEYIKNTYFVDGGAYIGDSALVLSKYSPKKIFSFELSKSTTEKYNLTMKSNKINEDKFCIINKGLSDCCKQITFLDTSDQGASLCYEGNVKIDTVSVDSFFDDDSTRVGFIKADVEGYGLKALIGMKNTIARDRPVLSLAIYHTPEEFFEMKPYLAEITKDLNYNIEIQHLHCYCDFLVDVCIIAYPKELYSPVSVNFIMEKVKNHPFARLLTSVFD